MVIDANTRPIASNGNVGRSLSRDEVIGTALAPEAFSIVDAIWLNEPRIAELRAA
jgi:hypothetical protein